jgi:hypothetical protein
VGSAVVVSSLLGSAVVVSAGMALETTAAVVDSTAETVVESQCSQVAVVVTGIVVGVVFAAVDAAGAAVADAGAEASVEAVVGAAVVEPETDSVAFLLSGLHPERSARVKETIKYLIEVWK